MAITIRFTLRLSDETLQAFADNANCLTHESVKSHLVAALRASIDQVVDPQEEEDEDEDENDEEEEEN